MSSRPNVRKYHSINAQAMTGNITSNVTVMEQPTLGAYQYSWTGTTPVGAISVEVSNDFNNSPSPDGGTTNPGTWTAIYFQLNGGAMTNSAPVSGNTGTGLIEFSTSAYAVRTIYTFGSGTGTLDAYINCKVA